MHLHALCSSMGNRIYETSLGPLLETEVHLGRFLFLETYKDVREGWEDGSGHEKQGLGAKTWSGKSVPWYKYSTHGPTQSHTRYLCRASSEGLGGEKVPGEDAQRAAQIKTKSPGLDSSSISCRVFSHCFSHSPQRTDGVKKKKNLIATSLNLICAPEHKPCLTHKRSREKQIKMSNCSKTN